jgi:hypothetical protein
MFARASSLGTRPTFAAFNASWTCAGRGLPRFGCRDLDNGAILETRRAVRAEQLDSVLLAHEKRKAKVVVEGIKLNL